MKKISILTLSGLLALTALCGGEMLDFPEKADWQDSPNLKTLPGDVLEFSKGAVRSTETVKAEPGKTTIISGEFRCPVPGKKVRVFFAFSPLDAQKKNISALHVNAIANTDTVLTAPVKKGDTSVIVKDGSKFNKGMRIVFNTKEDYSDLPNRDISSGYFAKSEKLADGTWKITFQSKIYKDYPAGTKVRAHASGGYQYAAIFDLADTKWKSVKGTVKGMVKKGMGGASWAPGSKFANIVIFSNGKAPVQFRNIKYEVK